MLLPSHQSQELQKQPAFSPPLPSPHEGVMSEVKKYRLGTLPSSGWGSGSEGRLCLARDSLGL